MKLKLPIILFFIADVSPTEDELAEAEELGPGVRFRNANLVSNDGCLEEFDELAGEIPQRYLDAKADKEAKAAEALERAAAAEEEAAKKAEAAEARAKAKEEARAAKAAASAGKAGSGAPAPGAADWKPNA